MDISEAVMIHAAALVLMGLVGCGKTVSTPR